VPVALETLAPGRRLSEFIGLPYRLHAQDPHWTPALRMDVRAQLSRGKNPFFEHAAAEYILARRGGRVVGRIAAIHNYLHNDIHGDKVGFFGFFECEEDPEAAAALFDAAAGWLREHGLDTLRGPASFSVNDELGLLVQGFDTPPVLMMPHNPPRYVPLLEGLGFTKAKDLIVFQRQATPLPQRLAEGAALLEKRYQIRVRSIDMKRFEDEVGAVKKLFNSAWEKNWGYVPMTDREIDHLAQQLKQIVVPELVLFAEREGETIGFAVALPDLNVALRTNRSGRLFPGILKVLWAARKVQRLRIALLGAVPEWQGRGVDALLYKSIWENAMRKGFNWGEAGWILEDNHAMVNGLVRMGFEPYKTYRVYDRAV
jgi:GNAT superfamily N-acetyltransferase